MASVLGARGQLVIEKPIRDSLGLEPGYISTQRLVDDRVEIRFYPPEHRRSLLGVLGSWATRSLEPDDWHEVREKAWADSASDLRPSEDGSG